MGQAGVVVKHTKALCALGLGWEVEPGPPNVAWEHNIDSDWRGRQVTMARLLSPEYSHRQIALWFLADLRRWPYLLAFRTSCSHRMLVLTARNDGASMAEEGCGMVVDRGECTDVSSYLLTMTTFGGLQASLRRLSSPRLPPSL
ncbi:hypothetical protein C0Q70_04943 [Pomacea canaliculata]|uniref:Uncharacterized protein n=1 Tax=Pomacea canaliculata TaxID=400727 RepID=A0A2T7PJT0_POMCA|nr:hypothetical protein C0Q70_04943 [Pomacea canaliculata]